MSERTPEANEQPESAKAVAALEAAAVLESINFPEDFESLKSQSPEQLQTMREVLITELQDIDASNEVLVGKDGYRAEILAQRTAILDELLSSTSSESRAQEIFTNMETV